MDQLNLIIPELFLTTSIMILLMLGVFYKNSFNLIFKLSTIVLLATFILLFNHSVDTSAKLFNNSYTIDYLSLFMKALTLVVRFSITRSDLGNTNILIALSVLPSSIRSTSAQAGSASKEQRNPIRMDETRDKNVFLV